MKAYTLTKVVIGNPESYGEQLDKVIRGTAGGRTLAFSVGKWAGFYLAIGYTKRIILGWFAITWFPVEIDNIFLKLMQQKEDAA